MKLVIFETVSDRIHYIAGYEDRPPKDIVWLTIPVPSKVTVDILNGSTLNDIEIELMDYLKEELYESQSN